MELYVIFTHLEFHEYITVNTLNTYIDLTLLKPTTTRDDIAQLCAQAIETKSFSVCVPGYFVSQCAELLENTEVKICTVIGFPYGNSFSQVKAEEIRKAIEDGVDEIDLVINISAIKSGDWTYVSNELYSLVRLCHMRNVLFKCIIEMNALTIPEIDQVCAICVEKEVDFVKTSTGTYGESVTPKDIAYLRSILPASMKIKASGGIRNREQALEMIAAGADRIGTSTYKLLLED